MAKGSRTKEQLQIENRVLRQSQNSQGIYAVIRAAIKYGCLAFIVLQLRYGVEALAGHETIGAFSLNLLADLKANEWVAYLFGGVGLGYGGLQRQLRKNTVERVQVRNEDLERRIDPGRSSSKLTRRGETRKEDR